MKNELNETLRAAEAVLLNTFNSGPFGGPNSGIFSIDDWMNPKPLKPTVAPPADTYREGDDFLVALDLPGVASEDVNVALKEGALIISGDRKRQTPTAETESLFKEISYGEFLRKIALPRHVTEEQISAELYNGVLSIRVRDAYVEPAKPEPTKIKINVG